MDKQQLWEVGAQSQGPTATHARMSWGPAADGADKPTDGPESGWGPLVGKDQRPRKAGERPGLWNLVDLGPNSGPATHLLCKVLLSEPRVSYLCKGGLDLIPSQILGAAWGVAQRGIPETGKEKFLAPAQAQHLSGLFRSRKQHGPHSYPVEPSV